MLVDSNVMESRMLLLERGRMIEGPGNAAR